MARRCVGWASAAVTHLIWELDMADWLGSRTQLKHLCCSHSHITAGPNKILGSRRAEQEVAQAQRRTFPASKDFALGPVGCTLSVKYVTLVCRSVAVGCIKKGKCHRAAVAHVQTHQQAGTAVLIFGCKRNDTLLKPQRGFQSFTVIYSLFVPVPTSGSVHWLAGGLTNRKICSVCKFRIYGAEKYADIMLIVRQPSPYLP